MSRALASQHHLPWSGAPVQWAGLRMCGYSSSQIAIILCRRPAYDLKRISDPEAADFCKQAAQAFLP